MKTRINRAKILAVSATILFIISLAGYAYMHKSNKSTQANLNELKLQSENLLSEKLLLDKMIDKNNKHISTLNEKNGDLNKMLAASNTKLRQKEAEIQKLQVENQKTRELEKQLAEIRKTNREMESQMAELKRNINNLEDEKNSLNAAYATLHAENKQLIENAAILSRLAADNFLVETFKGKKDKLTVSAKKTKKLTVEFDVPQSITATINFKVTTPQGNTFTSADGRITYIVMENEAVLYASVSPLSGELEASKRVEMVYKPKEKLTAGIYKIEIFNNSTKLGSCQVKLK